MGVLVFVVSYILFKLGAMTFGVRASEEEEKAGLDMKHGQTAYPDFGK